VNAVEGQQVKRGQLLFTLDDTGVRADLAQARADMALEEEALRCGEFRRPGRSDRQSRADLQKALALREQLRLDNESLTKTGGPESRHAPRVRAESIGAGSSRSGCAIAGKNETNLLKPGEIGHRTGRPSGGTRAESSPDLEQKLSSTRGIAPADGTLYSLPIHPGDFVKEGDLLAEMADMHHVRVRALLMSLNSGRSISTRRWRFSGTRIPIEYGAAVPRWSRNKWFAHGTRNVGELLCSVSNDHLDLIPNTTVDVRIHISERPSVIVVPRGAVFIEGSKRFVFVCRVIACTVAISRSASPIRRRSKLFPVCKMAMWSPCLARCRSRKNLHIRPVRQE